MKKNTILILLVLPTIMLGQANKFIRQGLKTTDLKEKVVLFTKAIELEPKKLDAYFYRAIAKNDLGDFHGAIVDYSKIILNEPDADTYYNRGNSRYSIEDIEGAKNDYNKAIEIDPYFVDAIYSLGCSKYDLNDFEGSIVDFSKVVKLQPYHTKAYELRANAYAFLKKSKKALADYTLSVLINHSPDSYYNRGVFYMDINYYKKAKSDLSTSIRLNENNGFAYFYRGVSNLLLGKYKNAISDFSTALKFDSSDFDAMLGLAMTYYRMEDIANAKLNLKKAEQILKTNNNNQQGINLFSNTYWQQNQAYYFNAFFNTFTKLHN